MADPEFIPAAVAFQRAGLTYNAGYARLLQGVELEGKQEFGRWFVSSASLCRLIRQRERAAEPNPPETACTMRAH